MIVLFVIGLGLIGLGIAGPLGAGIGLCVGALLFFVLIAWANGPRTNANIFTRRGR